MVDMTKKEEENTDWLCIKEIADTKRKVYVPNYPEYDRDIEQELCKAVLEIKNKIGVLI